jgi:pimeloyl-ACP methyl ester carboxylesterase
MRPQRRYPFESVMEKPVLVLVHSFYANSTLLRGMIEYLEDFFRVHFIDLPGFAGHVPPLARVTIENFSRHVERRIEELGLESYILCGISFGFLVACGVGPNHGCRGLAAIVPYLDARSLKLGWKKRLAYALVTKSAVRFGLAEAVWRSKLVRRFAYWYSVYPPERVDVIFAEMDPVTFFRTGKLILEHRAPFPFRNKPTALILSDQDGTIENDRVREAFAKNLPELLIVDTSLEHYPVRLDKEHFRERFPPADIERIIRFFEDGKPRPEADPRHP